MYVLEVLYGKHLSFIKIHTAPFKFVQLTHPNLFLLFKSTVLLNTGKAGFPLGGFFRAQQSGCYF